MGPPGPETPAEDKRMMPGNRTLVDFPAPQKQGANPADPAAPEGVPDYQSAFPRHAPAEPPAERVETPKPSVNLQSSPAPAPARPAGPAVPPLIPPPPAVAPPAMTPAPAAASPVITPAPVPPRVVEKPVLKPVGIETAKPVTPIAAAKPVAAVPPPAPVPVAAPIPAPAPAPVAQKSARGGMTWGKFALGALSVIVIGQGVVIAGLVKWGGTSSPTETTPPPVATPAPPPVDALPVAPPVATPAPPAQGQVEVTSEPSGAKVIVDGTERGVTPLTLTLDPGAHSVIITDGRSTTTRNLEVAAGGNVALAATLAPAGLAAGYVTISSPIDLQVFENGQPLGTSASKLLLPAGRHELDVVNEALEFQQKITVNVQAGGTAKTNVPLPNGSISVNALPWAIVWIDGKDVGTTPVATMTVPIGNHEVVWRHPQFGERKQTVTVTAKMPVRLVMDFNR